MIHNLYKYTKATEYTLDAIRENKIWFSRADKLNDPFEFAFRMTKSSMIYFAARIFSYHNKTPLAYEVNKIISDDAEVLRLKRDCIATISDLQSRYVVLSLTKKWDSPTMWAHYSNEHHGLCIKYKLDDTENWHMPQAVEVGGPKKYIGKITYTSKSIQCYDKFGNELPGLATKALLRKHSEWAYEEEYRLIADDFKGNKDGKLFKLPEKSITEVILGYNINKDYRVKILELLRILNIPAYEVSLNTASYKMIKKRI